MPALGSDLGRGNHSRASQGTHNLYYHRKIPKMVQQAGDDHPPALPNASISWSSSSFSWDTHSLGPDLEKVLKTLLI